MTVYTEYLTEAMGLTEAEAGSDYTFASEQLSVLDSVDGGLSLANKSQDETLSVAESVAVNWNNSTFHDILAGEYVRVQESVIGWIQGNVYTVSLTESISVLDVAARDVTFIMNETLNIADSVYESGKDIYENFSIVDSVISSSGKVLNESLSILELLGRKITANRAVNEALSLVESTVGIIFRNGVPVNNSAANNCPANIRTTLHIELYEDPSTSVTLKVPKFGDTHEARTSIITQGDIYIRRNLSDDKLKLDFEGVLEKATMISFFNACRGKLVVLTDQYDNEWLGFLTNKRLSVETIFEHQTCDDYGYGFEFEGKRITDGGLN